jgi:uncharacterized protein YkwD
LAILPISDRLRRDLNGESHADTVRVQRNTGSAGTWMRIRRQSTRPLPGPRITVPRSSRSSGRFMSINLQDPHRKGKSRRRARCGRRAPGKQCFGAFLGTIALIGLLTSPSNTSAAGGKTHAGNRERIATVKSVEEKILQYTNEERLKRRLPLLQPSDALKYVARRHSGNMCATKRFEHESSRFPRGWQRFETRLKRAGLETGGENIGYQTITRDRDRWARKMVRGWMRSPSHRRNILDPRFRYLGVGVRPCDNRLGYATQLFSRSHGRVEGKGRLRALDGIRQENRYWKARSVQAGRAKH